MILLLNITVFLDFESTGNKLLLFTIQIEVLVVLQINMIKLSVNKTKWPGLSDRTRAFILQILIQILNFGPEKLPGLSRIGPLVYCNKRSFERKG